MTHPRTMFDSVNPAAIPPDAPMVAGYINGKYAWHPSDWELFPHSVRIDVLGTAPLDAGVLDVESGNPTMFPPTIINWVKKRTASGHLATIYCNRSTWPWVQSHVSGLKVAWWIADWTHVPHSIPGAALVQWTDGRAFDTSSIYDATWHPAPGTGA